MFIEAYFFVAQNILIYSFAILIYIFKLKLPFKFKLNIDNKYWNDTESEVIELGSMVQFKKHFQTSIKRVLFDEKQLLKFINPKEINEENEPTI